MVSERESKGKLWFFYLRKVVFNIMIRMDSLDFVNKEAKRESSSVKLQSSNIEESFTNKVIMFHHGNHHRPFSSSSSPSYEVKVGDGGDGPTCKNRSIIVSNDTYDVVVGGSGSAVAVTQQQQHPSGGAGVRTVQPFDTATTPHTASKSPGFVYLCFFAFPFSSQCKVQFFFFYLLADIH